MIVVYTVIFSQIMQAKLPGVDNTFGYSIYLCAGILSWGLFAEITTRSQNIFLEHANLLKKLSFPRLCLPVTVVISALINFSIVFGLFTGFLLITGNFPGLAYVALMPLLVLLVFLAIGLGVLLGVLNVFFRDVGQFFGIFITFWFWLTPIVYPITILPESAQRLMSYNPMSSLLGAVQGVLVQGIWPTWGSLVYPLALAMVLFFLGWRLFRKRSGELVDEL
jgi:lipopolysaccharide transport system permease protein